LASVREMGRLTDVHRVELQRYVPAWISYLGSKEGSEFYAERRARVQRYQAAFADGSLASLSEADLTAIVHDLWANAGWKDPTQPLRRILRYQPLEDLKAKLAKLLWGSEPIATRFDAFVANPSGMGPGMSTELLALVHPGDYAIWNQRVRAALSLLKLGDVLPADTYLITGSQYSQIISIMCEVREVISRHPGAPEPLDLLGVDYFLYSLAVGDIAGPSTPQRALGPRERAPTEALSGGPPPVDTTSGVEEGATTEHTTLQWMLLKLGSLKGYQVWVAPNDKGKTCNGEQLGTLSEDELPLPGFDDAARRTIELIDVVWFKDGAITHLFEVETSTSIYSGLLRMADLIVQQPYLPVRGVIVAPPDRQEKFEQEIHRPAFKFVSDPKSRKKDRFEFMSSDELRTEYGNATGFKSRF
jgi:hypothetical protein